MSSHAAVHHDAPTAAPAPRRRSRVARRLRVLTRHRPVLRFLLSALGLFFRVLFLPLAGMAAASVVLWHVFRRILADGPFLLDDASLELAMLVAMVVLPVAIAWTHWRARVQYRRLCRNLGKAVEELSQRPTLAASRAILDGGQDATAEKLTRPLADLAERFRQTLVRVAQMQDALEATQGSSPPTSFPLEHSRAQMVGRLTPNLRWQTATPMLLKLVGRPIERLNGRDFLRFIHADDRERVEKALQETLREGETHNIVFRLLPPAPSGQSGETPSVSRPIRYLQADVLACYDAIGRPEQLRCHFVDVTERVLTEQALRRRTDELMQANERLQSINRDLERLKESYRDLYHHAPVMYFSLDEKGHFAAVNETMLRELGYQRGEMLGQPFALILAPESRETFREEPGVLRRAGEIETQWQGKDGRVRDVWIGLRVVGRARELERANGELRRINQELEEFTYVVSHDLKEPLRTLEAFSGFLASDYAGRLDEDGREYISHLIAASRRLGKLIDDLLTLSRAGRVMGKARPLDWAAIVETVKADLQLLITRRPGCVIRVAGPLPVVQGDPERITQLVSNLVGNALKYNESLTPEVTLGSLESPGPLATLFVRDNGVGIDPRYHDQIFRIFRRLHRRDEYEGTGAGLAICKKVVEAHGGRLWVESAPGQGSTFFFTLPRVPAGSQDTEHGAAAAAGR